MRTRVPPVGAEDEPDRVGIIGKAVPDVNEGFGMKSTTYIQLIFAGHEVADNFLSPPCAKIISIMRSFRSP
jgi:hypothetical protein